MTGVVLFDDAAARRFEPFALTRPCGELRAGVLLGRERWAVVTGAPVSGYVASAHLSDFAEFDAPSCLMGGTLPAGTLLANARFAPALAALPRGSAWRSGGQVVAVRLARALDISALADGAWSLDALLDEAAPTTAIEGWWLEHPWDLLRHLPAMLGGDIAALAPAVSRASLEGHVVLGANDVVLEQGSRVEPFVVFDASAGPILVRAGATVAAFTRLVGPCAIGRDTQVLGGKVATASIGEMCRVHGELSTSIFIGHANKGHDGFVGHSVLGRWTNLGAATVTSNLKNTYGNVQTWTPGGDRDTGLQFLGTLLGDHAKTAIGTRLMTGTVVGAGANVVSDGLPAKVIPPFAWGDDTYRLDKFLEVAARVMARRHVTMGDRERVHLTRVHGARWSIPR
ncbi:MAG: hypothetical protein H7066_09310 [Cytophagaceae bacterium]|nr:hypothetical protein [Gemmatimonadaceae bacterium]